MTDRPLPPDAPAGATGATGTPAQGSDPTEQSQQAYITLLFNKYRGALHRYLSRLVPIDDAAELHLAVFDGVVGTARRDETQRPTIEEPEMHRLAREHGDGLDGDHRGDVIELQG